MSGPRRFDAERDVCKAAMRGPLAMMETATILHTCGRPRGHTGLHSCEAQGSVTGPCTFTWTDEEMAATWPVDPRAPKAIS